jgi:hypothetical protein
LEARTCSQPRPGLNRFNAIPASSQTPQPSLPPTTTPWTEPPPRAKTTLTNLTHARRAPSKSPPSPASTASDPATSRHKTAPHLTHVRCPPPCRYISSSIASSPAVQSSRGRRTHSRAKNRHGHHLPPIGCRRCLRNSRLRLRVLAAGAHRRRRRQGVEAAGARRGDLQPLGQQEPLPRRRPPL